MPTAATQPADAPEDHGDQTPASDGPSSPSDRSDIRLAAVVAGLLAVAAMVLLGRSLLGQQTLTATDQLLRFPPWSADAPLGFHGNRGVWGDTYDIWEPQRLLFADEARDGRLAPGAARMRTNSRRRLAANVTAACRPRFPVEIGERRSDEATRRVRGTRARAGRGVGCLGSRQEGRPDLAHGDGAGLEDGCRRVGDVVLQVGHAVRAHEDGGPGLRHAHSAARRVGAGPLLEDPVYRGRAGIHELLVASDEMKRMIQNKARVAELLPVAKAEGMTTLVQDGIMKALAGITDYKQVKAVAIK